MKQIQQKIKITNCKMKLIYINVQAKKVGNDNDCSNKEKFKK